MQVVLACNKVSNPDHTRIWLEACGQTIHLRAQKGTGQSFNVLRFASDGVIAAFSNVSEDVLSVDDDGYAIIKKLDNGNTLEFEDDSDDDDFEEDDEV